MFLDFTKAWLHLHTPTCHRMPATPANNLIQVTGSKFSETSGSFQQSQAEVTGYK